MYHVEVDARVEVAREFTLVDQPVAFADEAQFADEAGVEGDFVQPVRDFVRRPRYLVAHNRVQLDDQGVTAPGGPAHRLQCRVGDIAAVPIAFSVDDRRVEQIRQAPRCQHHVDGQFVLAKAPESAGGDVGGIDEQLDLAALADAFEVDQFVQRIAQRVDLERIGDIRRNHPRDRQAHLVDRRKIQRIIVGLLLPERALERRHPRSRIANSEPEMIELRTGMGGIALHQAFAADHGVHRASARAADRGNLDIVFLEQAVEDAPGEGTVAAAALQCQVDLPLFLRRHLRLLARCARGFSGPSSHRRREYWHRSTAP